MSEIKKEISSLINLSITSYEEGDYAKAENLCHKVLEIDPQNAPALINLGNIFYQKKDIKKALELYQKAAIAKPDYYTAEINLANAYIELKDYNGAILHAKKASVLNPSSALANAILGNAYLEKDDLKEAINAFEKARELDAEDPWIENSLSQAYQKNLNWNKAVEAAIKAIEKSNGADSHHINFGYLLYEYYIETGEENIKKIAVNWLQKYPENNVVIHMAGALINDTKITRANDDYLKKIFDVFSTDFDVVLGALDYQVPALIKDVFDKAYKDKKEELSILDIGCGTGLVGARLKDKNHRITGVDISEKMIETARKKNIYNDLFCEELSNFLSTKKDEYNLVVSGDVFTYIGDLKESFSLIKKSLKKDGHIIFSVSENNVNNDGFFLHVSGRFLHSEKYIKALLKESGFDIEIFERHRLRNEADKKVWGFVVSVKSI